VHKFHGDTPSPSALSKIGAMKVFPRYKWDLPVVDAISLAKVVGLTFKWFAPLVDAFFKRKGWPLR